MSRTITQSIFQTAEVKATWRSYVTSGAIHAVIVSSLFAIAVPVGREVRKPVQRVILVVPRLPEYKTKLVAPIHAKQPKPITRVIPPPRPVLSPVPPPPAVKPPVEERHIVAAAPEVKVVQPAYTPVPDGKPNLPPAPKPAVKTGVFQSAENTKGENAPKQLQPGGFGDASVSAGALEGASGGTVRTGGFADNTTAIPAPPRIAQQPAAPVFTPVEILYKPKPGYTEEARSLRLEGQVSLEVVFLASGSIRVVRVLHGLGHGLDEAAEQAAMQVRFKPATRGGVPVDTNATVSITFELT